MQKQWIAMLLAASVMAAPAAADTKWPERAIRVIVPYTPGGGTDGVTRNLADKMARATQWNLVIENKPGAGGNIGMNQLAKSEPDGYTLGMGQTSNLAVNPAVMPNMPFDAAKDFTPIAVVAEIPMLVVVRADAPWKNLGELITEAKQRKPGTEIRQAVATLGTVGHLAGEMLARAADIKFLVVPYKVGAPAINDLIGGQTDVMFATPQTVMKLIEGGKLRTLASTSSQRLDSLKGVPTVAELGYPNFEAVDWKVVVAPASTPEPIVKRVNEAINQALKDPALLAQLHAEGSRPVGGTVQATTDYVKAEQASWAKLIKDAKISF